MQTILKVGGAILSALVVAISSAFNAFDIVPNISWSWVTFISVILFIVFVFWGWVSAETKVTRLLNTKPHIKVIPDGMNIRIRNEGAYARFRADIVVTGINDLSKSEYVDKAPVYWDKSKSFETEIMKFSDDKIVIAKVDSFINSERLVNRFVFCRWDIETNSPHWRYSDVWFSPTDETIPEYTVKLTITSCPEMEDMFVRFFRLSANGLKPMGKVMLR